VTVSFFNHCGAPGPEDRIGALGFPDYSDGDPSMLYTPEHIAVAIWNMHRPISDADLDVCGVCFAISATDEPLPLHCSKDNQEEDRYRSIWDVYDALLETRTYRGNDGKESTNIAPFPYPKPGPLDPPGTAALPRVVPPVRAPRTVPVRRLMRTFIGVPATGEPKGTE
jgi:hypothetical protein